MSCDWATSPRFCSHWILIGLSKSGHVSHLSRPFVWRPSSSSAELFLCPLKPGASSSWSAPPPPHQPRTHPPPGRCPPVFPDACVGCRPSPPPEPHPAPARLALDGARGAPAAASAPTPWCRGRARSLRLALAPRLLLLSQRRLPSCSCHPTRGTPAPATADRWVAAAPGSTTLGAVFPAACNFNAMEALSKISLSPSACLAAQRKVSARVAHTAAPATAPVPAPSLQGCSGRS